MKKENLKTGTISLFMLFTFIAVLSGCKKDDPSNTDKIINKDFKLTALTVDPARTVGGIPVTDAYSLMPDCSKDNIMRFAKSGTFTIDEGATKCDSLDPQTTSGTWLWTNNETVLTIMDASDTTNLYVLVNDGTIFKGSFETEIAGVNYTYTLTYTKQ